MGKRGRRRKQILDDVKKRKDTVKWKRKHQIALCGELALKEAVKLSEDRLRSE